MEEECALKCIQHILHVLEIHKAVLIGFKNLFINYRLLAGSKLIIILYKFSIFWKVSLDLLEDKNVEDDN